MVDFTIGARIEWRVAKARRVCEEVDEGWQATEAVSYHK